MDHLQPVWSRALRDGRTAHVVVTDRSHGDLSVHQPTGIVEPRRRAVVDAPWTWLQQVHGADVIVVDRPGAGCGTRADAACTTISGAPLAAHFADCAPIALVSDRGAVAAIHAGWRGLASGVVEAAAARLTSMVGPPTSAVVGPCIRPGSYEFGAADLEAMVGRLGAVVRATTDDGAPAFDLPAAVGAALRGVGVEDVGFVGGCTAREADIRWSHRARGDVERHAMVVWIDDPGTPK